MLMLLKEVLLKLILQYKVNKESEQSRNQLGYYMPNNYR